jgi:hypothetical protein
MQVALKGFTFSVTTLSLHVAPAVKPSRQSGGDEMLFLLTIR